MHFDAATGKVKCDYCDSTFTIEEVKKSYEEKNQKAREAAKEAAGATAGLGAEELGIEAPMWRRRPERTGEATRRSLRCTTAEIAALS